MPSAKADALLRRALKPAAWVGCLLPLAWTVFDAFTGGLGADPIREVTHRTGFTALTLLMATLAVTPLRRMTGWNPLVQLRRLLGLFAFFYACLHFAIYLADQGFDAGFIVEDVVKHPYVTVGFTALLLLIPLAVTSTRKSIRRLGKRWVKLHRMIYLVAALGVVHFYWLVKRDVTQPLEFGAVFLVLMALRLPLLAGSKKMRPARSPSRSSASPQET
ncbi:MAG: ferric reductase like transrane component family protein [Gemmatimonadetes bacterium]|nr:ferric reductase like transrane component family protein [Gemmatimonadota bacterium]